MVNDQFCSVPGSRVPTGRTQYSLSLETFSPWSFKLLCFLYGCDEQKQICDTSLKPLKISPPLSTLSQCKMGGLCCIVKLHFSVVSGRELWRPAASLHTGLRFYQELFLTVWNLIKTYLSTTAFYSPEQVVFGSTCLKMRAFERNWHKGNVLLIGVRCAGIASPYLHFV